MSRAPISHLLRNKKIILCCGSGGVGKTTTSAALAMYAAQQGARVIVCTIDPARRLANSLGLTGIGHDPVRIDPALYEGRGRGELYAMMLEPRRSFDAVIEKFSPDPKIRDRILNNKIYTSLAGKLAGSQEHGAIQKLYELDQTGAYELIVLDTPPTQNALDFLDAPRKMVEAIDSPAIEWFLKPFQKTGAFSLKVLSFSASFVLKNLGRFTGMGFIEQMAEFFLDFQHLTASFRERAGQVYERLRSPEVGFVIVTSPDPMAISEGLYFHDRLKESNMPLGGFVVNRVRQPYGAVGSEDPNRLAQSLYQELKKAPPAATFPDPINQELARTLGLNLTELNWLASSDRDQIQGLRKHVGEHTPIVELPRFVEDIHDTQGLLRIVDLLAQGGIG
jgi:anion-transporting  ArsA/GET3 family ATPase